MSSVFVLSVRNHSFRQSLHSPSTNTRTRKNTRAISVSAINYKALPFTLNNNAKSTTHSHSTSTNGEEESGNMLRMIMFGKPGAGKGTLSSRLVKKYDIVSISTGDLLRQHIVQKTDIGRQAEDIVARGDFMPDELVLRVVTTELNQLRDKHWILDGFPRTIGQGELLDSHLRAANTPLTFLATLAVPTAILRARIASRFVHPASGRIYNLHFNPPRVPGQDDITGEPLIQRPDDAPEVYEHRLRAYEQMTAPLLGYYTVRAEQEQARGVRSGLRIASLAGDTSDEIWPVLEGTVREFFPAVRTRDEVSAAHARRRGPVAKVGNAVAALTRGIKAAVSTVKDTTEGAPIK